MTRTEIIAQFRAENPEIDSRVIQDATLQAWLLVGNSEICTITRCIKGENIWDTVAGEFFWDLTAKIPKFLDIDEYPGGGVALDNDRLGMTSPAELDDENNGWRDDVRNDHRGQPEKYFRYGQYIYTECPVDNVYEMAVDAVLLPDDYTTDVMPFNQLSYLIPYHYSLVLYLQKKAKMKVGKDTESARAQQEYQAYVTWMKKEIQGGISSTVRYHQPFGMSSTDRYKR
jgi:hypothetical protein